MSGHQTVRLHAAGDESRKVGVICKHQELDGLVTGGAVVGVEGEGGGGGRALPQGKGADADGRGVRDLFPHLHTFPSVRQEVSHQSGMLSRERLS